MEESLIDSLFNYHKPDADQLTKMESIRLAAKALAYAIDSNCPPSADRTAAMRLLREATMTANACIMLKGEGYK